MAHNYLEQMIAEWYEYQGYFVKRNIKVGKLSHGGYECELDIVAFDPKRPHLIHIEPSTDADSWEKREKRYLKKFLAGMRYIPDLFSGFKIPKEIDQLAVFVFGSKANHKQIANAKILSAQDIVIEIVENVKKKSIFEEAVPEQFPIIRTIQFVCQYEKEVYKVLKEK